jgi:dipeptidyl aminopeptidase/acylaminoacyl peptidase
MSCVRGKLYALLITILGVYSLLLHAHDEGKKPFTVADEIGLTLFVSPQGGESQRSFSPDGNYFAVWSERGRLDLNRVEDSLRIYRSEEIQRSIENRKASQPSPVWVVRRSTSKEGTIINKWRWLADSSGIAFLERSADGELQLALANLRQRKIEILTSVPEGVGMFDVLDRNHYVYSAAELGGSSGLPEKKGSEPDAQAIVGTGLELDRLLFPDDPRFIKSSHRKCLWAAIEGKHFAVKNDGALIFPEGELALSPDGDTVVTTVLAPEVPASWEALYPAPYPKTPYGRIRASARNVREYVQINLNTNSIVPLTDAPLAEDAGWFWGPQGRASWSRDRQELLLPGTFVKGRDGAPSRPCVAVINLRSWNVECVETLRLRTEELVNGHTEVHREEGYHYVYDAHFVEADKQQVDVGFINPDESRGNNEYRRSANGGWEVVKQIKGDSSVSQNGLQIAVKESFNEPPLLVASNESKSRTLWDPNPQLKNIEMGQATVYRWMDKEGRQWKGGLYKPIGYITARHYPLVIQTHGFSQDQFRPSGIFPTAFAAQALAASGIMVLQIVADEGTQLDQCTGMEEGPCGVSILESAASQLIKDGLVDAQKIGTIGFSRTVFQVMEQLTMGSLHLQAASITDGVMFDYFQYMQMPERMSREANEVTGAAPFGNGLQQWLRRSPGFNLDKVTTPLLVNAEGRDDILFMWQPYATLRYLKKPVDLILLNTDEHVLSNPAVRMASQRNSVDWFRFWLQGYEDPDPAKAEQYKRWRELRKLQAENDKKAPPVGANASLTNVK